MVEFVRNKNTWKIEAWKDGKKIGEIVTMGDMITKQSKNKK